MPTRARPIWLARHAAVDAAGVCYGRTDVPVRVPHDEACARLLATLPADAIVDVVWSSPTPRCAALAARFATARGVTHAIDPALCELDFGAWEGQRWADLERDDAEAVGAWMRDWQTAAPPNGERTRDLEERVRGWFFRLDRDRGHAVVAHSGVVRALDVIARGRTWDEAMGARVEHLEWRSIAQTSEPAR